MRLDFGGLNDPSVFAVPQISQAAAELRLCTADFHPHMQFTDYFI